MQSSLKSCSSDPSGDEIVLVGAGRVATQLGLALCRAGVSVRGVYSRNEGKASLLASRLASSVYCGTWEELLGQLPHRAVYLFCVSDDSIVPLAEQWEALEGTIIHTSGSVPIAMLTRWAKRLSGAEVVTLDSGQRQWLHLLGVLSNNFTNALLVEVQRLATEHQLPFDALEPILTETLAKAFALSPLQAQTGPARRGDQHTLAYHRELLAGAPRLLQLYDLFTDLIQAQDAKP